MNEYPLPEALSPLLQVLHDYRNNFVNWTPQFMEHTKKVKRGRARNKMAKASRKANRA